jgi:hypothetical protein
MDNHISLFEPLRVALSVDASDGVPVRALEARHAFNRVARSRLGDGPNEAVAPLLSSGPHFQAVDTDEGGQD